MIIRAPIIKAVSLTVILAAALIAQTPPADQKKSKVSGKLTNSQTSEPIRKARVSLHPDDPSKTVYTVETGASGDFHLENIDAGRYTLQGEKQGFVSGWYGASRPDGPGSTIELKPGKDSTELAFKLTPQGVIAGRVLDDEGEPVAGVMVMALHHMYISGRRQLVPVPNAMQIRTNDLGEYRLSNLLPGRYYIESSAQRMMSMPMGPEKPQGNAPEEGLVPVFFPNSPEADSASPVEVGPGAEVRGIDLRLRKTHVLRVSGKAIDASTGEPLKTGVIMLYKRGAGLMSVVPAAMFVVQGGKGEFELSGIAPGEYNVMAMATSDPQNMKMSMSRLDVGEKPVTGLVLNVGAGSDLQVATHLASGASADLSTIRIVLRIDDNPLGSLATTQMNKDGSGVLKHVTPDKYKIVLTGIPPDDYLLSARMGAVDVLADGLDLRHGAAAPLELTISSPAAKVQGTVKNEKGDLIPGAIITVVAKDPRSRTDMTHSATTDQNGHFRIGGMVPAEYRLYAWEDIEAGAGEDPEFRKPFEKMRADVDLSGTLPAAPVELKLITKAAVLDAQSRGQ